MTASPANTPTPAHPDVPPAASPGPEQPRRDRRERVLIGLAALGALGALATSLVALNRDVPFLDVAVARAAAQRDIDTPLAVTVPAAQPTTTSTAAPTTTTAVVTTVPAVLAATDPTLEGLDPAGAVEAAGTDDGLTDGWDDGSDDGWDDDERAWTDDPQWAPGAGGTGAPAATTPVTDPTWLPPTPEPTAPPTAETTPTTQTTAAPAPSTTAPTTSTTLVSGPPTLVVQLDCKNGTQGLTLTLTPNGDGTLKRLVVKGFPAACKKDDVRVVLTDAAGAVLAEANGRIRSSAPYNLDINSWPPVAVAQIAGVSISDL